MQPLTRAQLRAEARAAARAAGGGSWRGRRRRRRALAVAVTAAVCAAVGGGYDLGPGPGAGRPADVAAGPRPAAAAPIGSDLRADETDPARRAAAQRASRATRAPSPSSNPSSNPSSSSAPGATTSPSTTPSTARRTHGGHGGTGSRSSRPSPSTSGTSTPRPSPSSTTPAPRTTTGSAAEQVVALVNAERADAGCRPVRVDAALTRAAQGHSTDMASHDYFSHVSQDGRTFDQRIHAAGYSGGTLGENIAAGQRTAQAVMDSWMKSPGHRANILSCAFTAIGVGVASGGSYGTYWTQDFGG